MLLQQFKDRIKEAMKAGRSVERDVFKFVVSEVGALANSKNQANKPVTDEQIFGILRDTINNNVKLLEKAANPKLEEENSLLEPFLPKLILVEKLQELLQPIADQIQAVNEGQARGLAHKTVKTYIQQQKTDSNVLLSVDGEDINKIVTSIRTGTV